MQADDVGLGKQLVEADSVIRHALRAGAGRYPHRHAELARNARNTLSQCAVSDDTERHRGQFPNGVVQHAEVGGALPVARMNRCVIALEAVGQREQHAEHVLDDRLRTVVPNVGDRDAVFFRAGRVDVVGAGCGERYQFQLRRLFEQLARQANLVGEDDLRIGDSYRDRRVG